MPNNKTIKLYDKTTGRQVAEESLDKLKQMPNDDVLKFFQLQRELGREWDINVIDLVK